MVTRWIQQRRVRNRKMENWSHGSQAHRELEKRHWDTRNRKENAGMREAILFKKIWLQRGKIQIFSNATEHLFFELGFLYVALASFILVWSDRRDYFYFLYLLRLALWFKLWSVLEKVPCAVKRNMYLSLAGWNILYMSVKFI